MILKRTFIAVLLCAAAGFSQENYSQWLYSKALTLNTSATGANVATSQTGFPVLVRLDSINYPTLFSGAKSDGSDIRFANAAGVHLPYQI